MFVPAATSVNSNSNNNNSNNNNNNINCSNNITTNNLQNTTTIHHSDGPDSLNATYISVVSICLTLAVLNRINSFTRLYLCYVVHKQ